MRRTSSTPDITNKFLNEFNNLKQDMKLIDEELESTRFVLQSENYRKVIKMIVNEITGENDKATIDNLLQTAIKNK